MNDIFGDLKKNPVKYLDRMHEQFHAHNLLYAHACDRQCCIVPSIATCSMPVKLHSTEAFRHT